MADTTANKLEYHIKDLETISVTLSPHAATIKRRINDITLKPGPNEVTIYGLTPTTEEHSLQFEGQGAGSIADMTVEYVNNKDRFDSDGSDSEDSTDEEESDHESRKTTQEKAAAKELANLNQSLVDAKEDLLQTKNQVDVLEQYGKTLNAEHSGPDEVVKFLELHDEKRKSLYQKHRASTLQVTELEKKIQEQTKKLRKIKEARVRQNRKADKQKRKEAAKKAQAKADKLTAKRLAKEERRAFWPTKVYKLVLLLEAPSEGEFSSRRNSIDKLPASSASLKGTDIGNPISLSFSYVSLEASWWPAYDLKITTPSKSGSLTYRAEFKNATSETWSSAKLALTTSQATFSGLTSSVPYMHPWHVRLEKRTAAMKSKSSFGSSSKYHDSSAGWSGGLESNREITAKQAIVAQQQKPDRNAMFLSNNNNAPSYGQSKAASNNTRYKAREAQFCDTGPSRSANRAQQYQMYSAPPQGVQQFQQAQQAFGASEQVYRADDRRGGGTHFDEQYLSTAVGGGGPGASEPGSESFDDDNASISTATNALSIQESSREDFGLTTTYTVPSTRTLVPSHLTRRHNLAEIQLTTITLSHIIIPKLRPAAFLKARIRNTSPTTLLKGRANLTLDGAFLGTTSIPRASPDETFPLVLGIDPAIHVTYAKPTVRRSSTGVFSKEENVIYTRTIGLTNKKAGKVDLLVLDQVPVSEDEGLRMAVLEPAGLRNEGDRVRAGKGTTKGEWGSAVARLGKEGEIAWNVALNPGAGCKLVLEYISKFPAADAIVGID